ncbi:MAG: hypothetical protein ACHQRJ_05780 [Alphaproteobacteria bacterium]
MSEPPSPKPGLRRLYETFIVPDEHYYEALGRFVDEFARAETTAYEVLRYHAKLRHGVAAALLSGVRASDTLNRLGRLHQAGAISEPEWASLRVIFGHFNAIIGVRDLILHHGARADSKGDRYVSNALKVITDESARIIPISAAAVDDMRHDLRKISVHLRLYHLGRAPLRGRHPALDEIVHAPWRYKPPPSPPSKSKK